MSREKIYMHNIQIRLTAPLKQKLDAFAKQKKMSRALAVRMAIQKLCDMKLR